MIGATACNLSRGLLTGVSSAIEVAPGEARADAAEALSSPRVLRMRALMASICSIMARSPSLSSSVSLPISMLSALVLAIRDRTLGSAAFCENH